MCFYAIYAHTIQCYLHYLRNKVIFAGVFFCVKQDVNRRNSASHRRSSVTATGQPAPVCSDCNTNAIFNLLAVKLLKSSCAGETRSGARKTPTHPKNLLVCLG